MMMGQSTTCRVGYRCFHTCRSTCGVTLHHAWGRALTDSARKPMICVRTEAIPRHPMNFGTAPVPDAGMTLLSADLLLAIINRVWFSLGRRGILSWSTNLDSFHSMCCLIPERANRLMIAKSGGLPRKKCLKVSTEKGPQCCWLKAKRASVLIVLFIFRQVKVWLRLAPLARWMLPHIRRVVTGGKSAYSRDPPCSYPSL